MEPDKDYPGSDINILSNIATWQHCADLCYQNDQAPALLQYPNPMQKSNAEMSALAINGRLIRIAGVASARCGRGLARAWAGRR